jgi:hypothetical protein
VSILESALCVHSLSWSNRLESVDLNFFFFYKQCFGINFESGSPENRSTETKLVDWFKMKQIQRSLARNRNSRKAVQIESESTRIWADLILISLSQGPLLSTITYRWGLTRFFCITLINSERTRGGILLTDGLPTSASILLPSGIRTRIWRKKKTNYKYNYVS